MWRVHQMCITVVVVVLKLIHRGCIYVIARSSAAAAIRLLLQLSYFGCHDLLA